MITSKLSCLTVRACTGLFRRPSPVAAALMSAVALGGCASSGSGPLAALTPAEVKKPFIPLEKGAAPIDRAVQYWSQVFAKNPGDEKAAVAYARNLRAKGEKQKALQVLRRASISNSTSKSIASEYARLAVDLGQIEFAQKLIARATDPAKPDWRLISAEGAAFAKIGKHKVAQTHFLRALQLKPAHPPLLNNLALSYALNGDIEDAETLLRKAAARGANIGKIRKNLALVLGVQGKFNESQSVASAVYLDEGRARDNTELLKRWVKASPQSAPDSRAITTASAATASSGWGATTSTTPTAALRGATPPQRITPWSAEVQTADASSWQQEVGDGH